jgi:hypothetical protein
MAFRRFRRGRRVDVGGGAAVRVWYPTPARLRREFRHGFRPGRLVAIGCFLPPPYLAHLTDTRPRLIRRLAALEERWQHRFPVNWFGDHFLQLFQRTA